MRPQARLGTLAPAEDAVAEIAPIVMARVCGLPVSSLDVLAAPATMDLVRLSLDARAVAEGLAPAIGDALHALVPLLDNDKPARRAALKLRRDTHNLRLAESTETAIDRVLPHLAAPDAERLRGWLDAVRQAEQYVDKAAQVAPGELAEGAARMVRELKKPRIADGLALASPVFAQALLGGSAVPKWASRQARSAVAYLNRAAVKPSPFATLATLGVTGWSSFPALPDLPLSQLSSSRAVAMELLQPVEVIKNKSLRQVNGRWLAALPFYCHANTVFFREDEITDCGQAQRAVDLLPDGRMTLSEVGELLGIDAAAVRRLVAVGILQPVTPWRLPDGKHFAALPLKELGEIEARVAAPASGYERAVDVERARGVVTKTLGAKTPDWLPTAPLFHEVTAHEQKLSPVLPESVREDLEVAAKHIGAHVQRSVVYDRLLEFFRYRHGSGSGCYDLIGFCYDFLTTVDPLSLARELTDTRPHKDLRGHGTLGRPSNAVFFQLAASSPAAIAAGDYRFVVNSVQAGFPGMLGRWACVPALHDRLADPLEDWVSETHPGCEIYQLSAHADWVEFQRPAVRSIRRAAWASDLADGDPDVVDLRGFTLAHDPATDTLQVSDAQGRPAAFGYFGAIPPMILRGVDRLLYLLSDPWTAVHGGTDVPSDRITVVPRRETGRVLWRRATWLVPPAELPRVVPGESPVAFLTRVESWRRAHGLPDEVFLTQAAASRLGERPQKPQWLGFDHPHAIWAALRQVDPESGVVELTEALPARRQHGWHEYATEFTGLVRHG